MVLADHADELLQHGGAQGDARTALDFDRINNAEGIRISVGAVNVRTGRFAYFDSAEIAIRPEHVMASGSLPPGFPPVEIDGEYYWDGGLVSNTPLQYVLDYYPRRSRLTFQVDVFQGRGQLPTNLEEVSERDKDIRFSSRTRITTDNFRQKHEVRHAIEELMEILPPDLRNTEQANRLYEFGCVTEMDIVQLIYSPARATRRVQGLRVQPGHNGQPLAARAFGCPHHIAGRAMARANSAGRRCARVRCDARYPCWQVEGGAAGNLADGGNLRTRSSGKNQGVPERGPVGWNG